MKKNQLLDFNISLAQILYQIRLERENLASPIPIQVLIIFYIRITCLGHRNGEWGSPHASCSFRGNLSTELFIMLLILTCALDSSGRGRFPYGL